MTDRTTRVARLALPLLLALAVSAACTLQVGGGGKPSALTTYVGANGLLADPAATVHHPSLGVTLDRLWAARFVGVAPRHTPSPALVAQLAKDAGDVDGPALRLRWSALRADASGVTDALADLRRRCGADAGGAATLKDDGGCSAAVRSAGAFLTVTRAAQLPRFRTEYPRWRAPACPAATTTLDDQLVTVLCGRRVGSDALEAAVASAAEGGGLDSGRLWAAAAVAHASGVSSDALRGHVEDAVGGSQVQGVYFDEVPAQGTLLTSWALLHLAGSDRSGLDTAKLAAAVRREDTAGAADRVMLQRASLALLGDEKRPAREGPLRLTDPDGPYNPFIALAARDAGDLSLVSIGFTRDEARRSPEAFASWVLTRRIVTDKTVELDASDVTLLQRLAPEPAGVEETPVPRLLLAAALAAAGRPGGGDASASSGCGGASWLVATHQTCDVRASLLVALHHQLTTR